MTVLTRPLEEYHQRYSRKNNPKSVLKEYCNNMMLYLTKQFPDVPKETLQSIMNNAVHEKFKDRITGIITQTEPGNIKTDIEGSLFNETDCLTENILTPYGAFYCSVDEQVSMFTDYIKEQQALRKKTKKEELVAEAKGDMNLKQIKYLGQLATKVAINALSGVALSNVSFRSAINYNAITATARFSTMSAYALSEMNLGNNYFLFDEDQGINWITNLLRLYPGDEILSQLISEYKLKVPSCEDVIKAYTEQVNTYSKFSKNIYLKSTLQNLTNLELTFVFYGSNLFRMVKYNSEVFKDYFDQLVNIDNIPMVEGEIVSFSSLPDEMIRTYAIVALSDLIPDKMTPDEIATKLPEVNRKLVSVYYHIEKKLQSIDKLFFNLIALPLVPSEVMLHKNMMRKVTIISDTDSILFTNVNWVRWYNDDDIRITTKTSRFNALIVLLTSKIFNHHFAYVTASLNVDLENMSRLSYKNEFTYDIFLKTSIGKHYCGYIRYREGMRLNPPKLDLKGKQFRGSDLAKTTIKFIDWFIRWIFDKYLTEYKLTPKDLISQVIKFEQLIKTSILEGKIEFLGIKPLKFRSDYAKPESSNYLYFELWESVFKDKYGEIHLPSKSRELLISPIKFSDLSNLEALKKIDKDIYLKFVNFVKKYPKRTISRVLIPLDIEIPQELRSIADYKKIIKGNSLPISLILSSFNIVNNSDSKTYNMYSDIYPELLEELQKENQHVYRESEESNDDEDEDDEEGWENVDDLEDDEF